MLKQQIHTNSTNSCAMAISFKGEYTQHTQHRSRHHCYFQAYVRTTWTVQQQCCPQHSLNMTMTLWTIPESDAGIAARATTPKQNQEEYLVPRPPHPPCEGNTKVPKFDGNNTSCCSDTRGEVINGKVGHGSKSCGNNTYCCSDRGVALAGGGTGVSGCLKYERDHLRVQIKVQCTSKHTVGPHRAYKSRKQQQWLQKRCAWIQLKEV